MKTIRHILLLLYCLAYMALAADVKLAWDANPEPDVSYRVSYGVTSGNHPTSIEAGKALELTVPDLAPGTVYYFVVRAVGPDGLISPPSAELSYTIPKPSPWGWIVKYVDDEQADGYGAELTIDGDASTFWHTTWREGLPQKPMPHELQIDMQAVKTLSGITLLPRQDEFSGSNIKGYQFYLSADGTNWGEPVASGEIPQGKQPAAVTFPAQPARYLRLVILSAQDGNSAASLAELNIIEATAPVPPAAPKGLRVVEIQTSSNLTDWKTIAMIPQDPGNTPAEFVRARLTSVIPTP
jgi:hypothetical protein